MIKMNKMNNKQTFISRRKWLTMSGMGSLGAFLGMVNPGI